MSKPPIVSPDLLLPPPRGRPRWRAVIWPIIIFVAGGVCGTGLTIVVAVHRVRYAIAHPDVVPARLTSLLERRLALTPSQATRIRTILEQRQRGLQDVRRLAWPRVERQLQRTRAEIGRVLDDSQRKTWNEIFDEWTERWLPRPPSGTGSPPDE